MTCRRSETAFRATAETRSGTANVENMSSLDDAADVAEVRRLADELRRIINRLAIVRPPAKDSAAAADAAAQFADRLDLMRARSVAWEVSEAGLEPRDFVEHSPLSGLSNPLAPPLYARIVEEEGGGFHHRRHRDVRFRVRGSARARPRRAGRRHVRRAARLRAAVCRFNRFADGALPQAHAAAPVADAAGLGRSVPTAANGSSRAPVALARRCSPRAEGLFIAPRDGDYRTALGLG